MPWPFSAGETIVMITTVSTALVAIITALRTSQVHAQQNVIEAKVDTVHELTNSRLARIEGTLATTQQQLAMATMALQQAETVRKTLAGEAADELRQDARQAASPALEHPAAQEPPVPVRVVGPVSIEKPSR